MTASRATITSLLRDRAGWFVAIAWLLLVLTILACLTVGVASGISAFYHPQHEWANYNRAEARLLQLAFVIALSVALASSVTLALGWRTAAWVSVAWCWIGLIIGGALYLNSIEKGPQQFERYAGQQHFRIPWQYGPGGSDRPNPSGVTLFLCLDSLFGRYDAACTHRKQEQVSIYPPNADFMGDERDWQRHPNEMRAAGTENGHQAYVKSIAAEGVRKGFTLYYFRLTNSDGKLLRVVTCYEAGSCSHYAMIGPYILFYTAPRAAFPEWDAIDHKLTALVDSWAMP
jgi:hypothetical protein